MSQTTTFDSMTSDDRWLGYGYLGERLNALDNSELTEPEAAAAAEEVAAADDMILAWANEHGWTADQLFTWANSKDGRYTADAIFGGVGPIAERFAQAVRWGVLALPR